MLPLRAVLSLLGFILVATWSVATWSVASAQTPKVDTTRGDRMLDDSFLAETARLRDRCLTDIQTLDDWKTQRKIYRNQLFEMLGLDPIPDRTDLKPTITGRLEREDFSVEKLHFQSRPGLYVTGNLYLPKESTSLGRRPTVLYVCGHGRVKKGNVSFGNKVHYHHHGVWFARHGYVCLMIDSLQLGEIEGLHHGTYRHGMWWWNRRGYTPAGVEAWNCIRALDYLQSRPEVDPERLGVTGRSGGGIYSWWIAALDDRIKVAVPVAGITDLENHVVDGCVEGHCDCMFLVNTYRWDYPLLAALVAPRPLMIGNSDSDGIFPLNGVKRTYEKTRRIYELYGAADKISLNVTRGPHKDTPELRIPAFRWFDRHLACIERPIEDATDRPFTPEELKVFDELPKDERNTRAHEWFVPMAKASKDSSKLDQDDRMRILREKVFGGWPSDPPPLKVHPAFSAEKEGIRFRAFDFTSSQHVRLRLYLVEPIDSASTGPIQMTVCDEPKWQDIVQSLHELFEAQLVEERPFFDRDNPFSNPFDVKTLPSTAWIVPRGVGLTRWNQNEKKRTHIRRRFMLLGQTLDGMRVWDVRRAIQALRTIESFSKTPIEVSGLDNRAVFASLFEPNTTGSVIDPVSEGQREPAEPILLNIRRYFTSDDIKSMSARRTDPD